MRQLHVAPTALALALACALPAMAQTSADAALARAAARGVALSATAAMTGASAARDGASDDTLEPPLKRRRLHAAPAAAATASAPVSSAISTQAAPVVPVNPLLSETAPDFAFPPGTSERAMSEEIYRRTDAGNFKDALAAASAAIKVAPKSAAIRLAKAYSHRRASQYGPALLNYQDVLKLEPGNKDALQGRVYVLKEMGNASLAYDEASKHPEFFEAAYLSQLRHTKAVELYRAARAEGSTLERKQMLAESLGLLKASPYLDRGQLADQLMVLTENGDYETVVQVYERAQHEQGVADWAAVSVASSYSNLGKFAPALALLKDAHERSPNDLQTTYALVYAYCDLQRFAQARATIDAVVAALPAQHDEQPFARQLQAQVALWAGETAKAGRLFEAARNAYPDHGGIQKAYIAWLNAVGRHAQAQEQLKRLLLADGDDVEAKLMLAEMQADNHPGEARQTLTALEKTTVDDGRVARSRREVEQDEKASVWASVASEADRDSTGISYQVSVTSSALTQGGLRLVAELEDDQSTLTTGTVYQRQQGVGVAQPFGNTSDVQVLAVHSESTDRAGVQMKLTTEALDGLPVTVKASTLDAEVPARAVSARVTSKSASVEVSPVLFGGIHTSVSGTQEWLSDGNVRQGAGVTLSGTTAALGIGTPDWALRGGIDKDSKTNVSYFSPAHDGWSEFETGLRLPAWNAFGSQLLSLRPYGSVGTFSQIDHGTLLTTNFGLGLNWTVSKDLSVSFDAHRLHRPYDGAYSTQTTGQVTVQAKLP